MADITGQLQAAAGAGGEEGNPNAWDISKAYYDAGADAGDVSKAIYSGISKSVAAEENNPTGLFFKTDGTKMYVIGTTGDDVNEYTLSTPWLISSATYVQNFSISSQDAVPRDIVFKPDGTKMYVCGQTNASVYEYSLSTAWDISTASYVQSFSTSSQTTLPFAMAFKDDGTKMFICGYADQKVFEYALSTAWNISTASYTQQFSATQDTENRGMAFALNGTEMYLFGQSLDNIYQYSLSTAWDISSASYIRSFSTGSVEDTGSGIYFKNDGFGFYIIGQQNDTVYQYTIGGFSVAAQETSPGAIFFKPDGTKMYVLGGAGDDVNEYDLSTAWNITTASYLQNFSVASQETQPNGLFFKDDGTKMYVVGSAVDSVFEYALTVAWDISSASLATSFNVNAQETFPTGIFFKPDGTKMYIVGSSGDEVNEYDLSTAWDVSSASYVQNFSVLAQDSSAQDISFKPDGTKMYVLGNTGDDLNQYDLSTPWDISTASFVQSTAVIDTGPFGLYFRDNGEEFFVMGATADRVFKFSISPE